MELQVCTIGWLYRIIRMIAITLTERARIVENIDAAIEFLFIGIRQGGGGGGGGGSGAHQDLLVELLLLTIVIPVMADIILMSLGPTFMNTLGLHSLHYAAMHVDKSAILELPLLANQSDRQVPRPL